MITTVKKGSGLALLGLAIAAASHGASAECAYSVNNEWDNGYTAEVTLTNDGASAVSGWDVSWTFDANRMTNGWNAQFSGSNPYTASDMGWNGTLQPGQSVSFGFQVDKNGGAAEQPTLEGALCDDGGSSSSSSSESSSSDSSASSSSDPGGTGQQCNWYGTTYSLCESTDSGWGWENNESCIARSTCEGQPDPYGVIDGDGSSSSSLSSSSSSSSSESSSSESSSSDSSSSDSSSSESSSSSSSSSSDGNYTRVDNPFDGTTLYVDPVWSAKALAEPGGEAIAFENTAVWMDRIGAITDGIGLKGHLDEAVNQGADTFMFVVYNLPNRDCAALASNGELRISENGFEIYQQDYIAPIVQLLGQPEYSDLHIVAIVEVDSLPNLVTNLDEPDCQEAAGPGGYEDGIQHALNELSTLPNVYSYVDIAHSGWLGWSDNFSEAVQLIGNTIKGTDKGVDSIAGFVTNSANYTPLEEPYLPDPSLQVGGQPVRSSSFYEWNPYFGEIEFAQDWRQAMIQQGFPSDIGMLIDTGRNGWGGPDRPTGVSSSTDLDTYVDESRIDRRHHRGNWCNQPGGVGERPQANPAPGIDAYVWVKPQGESDGISDPDFEPDPNDPAKQHDGMCNPNENNEDAGVPTGALPNAPHAGRWFPEAFELYLQNAYPPLD